MGWPNQRRGLGNERRFLRGLASESVSWRATRMLPAARGVSGPPREGDWMTLFELLGLLRKHLKWLIVVPVACALIAAAYCYAMVRNAYTTSATLYVLVSEETAQGESYSSLSSNFSVSQQIATDISQLITSERVRADAAKTLEWSSIADYGISVASSEGSRVVRVLVRGPSPAGVAEVANAVAEVSSDVAQEVMNVQSVNVLDRAEKPSTPSGPSRKLYVLLAALGGLFATFAAVVLSSLFDTRGRDPKTAEDVSGISALGTIPAFGGAGRGSEGEVLETVRNAQDGMKTLLTNLMFLGVDEPIRDCGRKVGPDGPDGRSACSTPRTLSWRCSRWRRG